MTNKITNKLRRWFIDPWVPLEDSSRRRGQMLTGLVLTLILLGIPSALIMRAIESSAINGISAGRVAPALVLILAMLYPASRTRYQNAVVWSMIGLFSIPFYVLVLPSFGGGAQVLIYLVVPLLLSSIFFSTRMTILLAVANMVLIASLPIMFDDIGMADVVTGPLSVVGLTAILLVLSSVVRQELRTHRQNELQESERRLKLLMDFSPQMMAVHVEGICRYINPAGLHVLGAENIDQIVGRPMAQFLTAEEDHDDGDTIPARVMRHQNHDDFALRTNEQLTKLDGSMATVEVTSIPIVYNGILATQIIVREFLKATDENRDNLLISQHHREIFRLMSDGAYHVRMRDKGWGIYFEWIEGALTQILGYSHAEIHAMDDLRQILHEDDLPIVRDHIQRISAGSTSISEFRIITKAGDIRWLRNYAMPVVDEKTGAAASSLGIVQDITEVHQAEYALKSHALQQALVAELGQRVLAGVSVPMSIAEEVVTLVAQVINVDCCRIVRLDRSQAGETSNVVIQWYKGLVQSNDNEDDTLQVDPLSAYTLASGESTIVEDMTTDRRFKGFASSGMDVHSGIAVIIRSRSGLMGVLSAMTMHHHQFSLEDANFLQSLANVLGAYWEQERVRAAEQEQRMMAEALRDTAAALNSTLQLDEVLDTMLAHLSRVLPFDSATIMVVDNGIAQVIRHQGFVERGIPESVIMGVRFSITAKQSFRRMLESGQPVIWPDVSGSPDWIPLNGTEWIRAYIGAPIMYNGELLGLINVDSESPSMFTEVHARRLQVFADQASIAMRNARLRHDLDELVATRTAQLNAEQRRLRNILEASGEGILYTEGAKIRYANTTLCTMTGYFQDELEGQDPTILLGPVIPADDLKRWNTIRTTVVGGGVWRDDVTLWRKDGTSFDAGLTISPATRTHDAWGAVFIVRDISQEKQLESQQARFIANASHELRSPIASLNTRLYLMRHDPEHHDQHFELMSRSVDRLNRMVEDLLDISRFEHGVIKLHRRNTILQELISSVLEMYYHDAMEKDITLEHRLPTEPLGLYVDPDRIDQVLSNLVRNAIAYTQNGGHITVWADNVMHAINDEPRQPMAVIGVKDNGQGIPTQDLPQIFQPFYRVTDSTRGTGLGLSIAREIVLLHEGDIVVESVVEEGTQFCVYLPLQATAT